MHLWYYTIYLIYTANYRFVGILGHSAWWSVSIRQTLHTASSDKWVNMSPVSLRFVMFLFTAHTVFVYTAFAGRIHNRDVSSFDSLHLTPRPAYLPIMPYYEIDIPEQEGKFFGVMAATRYETVSIKMPPPQPVDYGIFYWTNISQLARDGYIV